MSNFNKVKLLLERTSGVPLVIFHILTFQVWWIFFEIRPLICIFVIVFVYLYICSELWIFFAIWPLIRMFVFVFVYLFNLYIFVDLFCNQAINFYICICMFVQFVYLFRVLTFQEWWIFFAIRPLMTSR